MDAGVRLKPSQWFLVLERAAHAGDAFELVQLLHERGGTAEVSGLGNTPEQAESNAADLMIIACEYGRIGLVRTLIHHDVPLMK